MSKTEQRLRKHQPEKLLLLCFDQDFGGSITGFIRLQSPAIIC